MGAFSDELDKKIVPEWRNAYCDYQQLKQDLRSVKRHPDRYRLGSLTSKISPLQQLSGTFKRISSLTKRMSTRKRHENDHLTVKVHSRLPTPGGPRKCELYETEVLIPFGDVTGDKIFFARLDWELNKVNQFYKNKEDEFLGRGENIKVQLRKLYELKLKQKEQRGESANHQGNGLSVIRDDAHELLELKQHGVDVESNVPIICLYIPIVICMYVQVLSLGSACRA